MLQIHGSGGADGGLLQSWIKGSGQTWARLGFRGVISIDMTFSWGLFHKGTILIYAPLGFFRKNARQPNVDQRKSCSPNCHEYVQNISTKNIAVWLRYSSKTTDRAIWTIDFQKTRVLEVNFWIPTNSCMNSCPFSICCTQYLFRKFRLSWND